MKILIVDDDIVGRKILMIMLKSYGYCHEAASNGEAITLFCQGLAEQPYDVVFLEVALQGGNGWETLQNLRQMEQELKGAKRTKYIMISTSQKNSSITAAKYKSQWDGYLIKPILPDVLERELQRLELTRPQIEIFNKRQLATLMIDVGDKMIVREMVIKFIAELPKKIMDMEKEVLNANHHHVQKMAHELVSISGTYGFWRLSEIVRTIEQAAIRSDQQTMTEATQLATKQWQEIQGPLADFMADCGVHDDD